MTLSMRRATDLAFQVVALLVLLIALAALGALIFDVVRDGIGRLSWNFITGYPSRRASRAGIFPALTGSASNASVDAPASTLRPIPMTRTNTPRPRSP